MKINDNWSKAGRTSINQSMMDVSLFTLFIKMTNLFVKENSIGNKSENHSITSWDEVRTPVDFSGIKQRSGSCQRFRIKALSLNGRSGHAGTAGPSINSGRRDKGRDHGDPESSAFHQRDGLFLNAIKKTGSTQ